MLTQKEKQGIQVLLRALTQEQLRSLASTASKGQIVCNSDAECVKAILAFEKNGEEFLHRRVISKKILSQYAHDENLQQVSECRSKDDVIKLVLQYWSGADHQVAQHSTSPSAHSEPPTNQTTNNYNLYQVNVLMQSNVASEYHQNSSDPSREDYEFGKTFCNWFFNMLNHSDPVSQGFGPLHFMPRAQLFTSFVSPGHTSGNSYAKNNDISNVFLDLSKNFKFNPNVSKEGLKVKSDPHGLKLILICGTLLINMSLCGTFQQSFGLVKDPNAAENWKIQVTALKCIEVNNPVMPALNESVLELENTTVEVLQKSLQL